MKKVVEFYSIYQFSPFPPVWGPLGCCHLTMTPAQVPKQGECVKQGNYNITGLRISLTGDIGGSGEYFEGVCLRTHVILTPGACGR